MAVYRYQVVSVGMWRGKIKRWNTTFHSTLSTSTSVFYGSMQAACYPNPGDVLGDCSGGIASISVYNAAGGPPISETIYFDWQNPGSWIPFTGTCWSSVTGDPPIDASGESAMIIRGEMAGVSATGKPVFTRKYIHAVPSRTAANYSDPDIPSAVITAVLAQFPPSRMQNPVGVAPGVVAVLPYYGNHQRVRGRRRTTKSVAAQSFSAGVVAGTAAGSAGAASPQS